MQGDLDEHEPSCVIDAASASVRRPWTESLESPPAGVHGMDRDYLRESDGADDADVAASYSPYAGARERVLRTLALPRRGVLA